MPVAVLRLQRFLHREPVLAQRPSLGRRLYLWTRRNPAAAIGAIAAIVCLVGFFAALTFGFVQARRALAQTEAEAAHAAQALAEALLGGTPYEEAMAGAVQHVRSEAARGEKNNALACVHIALAASRSATVRPR